MGTRLGRLLVAGLVAWLVMAAAAPARPALAAEPALIRLAFIDDWRALPAVVAIERGFFSAEGLIVSGLPLDSRASLETAFAERTVDMALIPQRTWLAMADTGTRGIAIGIGGHGSQMELVVREGRPIETLADLKNRRVAMSVGSPAYPILIRLLNQEGLEPENIRLTELPATELLTSFQRRQADAAFDVRHVTTPLVAEGGRVLLDAATIDARLGAINAVPLVVRADLVADRPETLKRVMAAWTHALAYIEAHREDAARLLHIYLRRRGIRITPPLTAAWVGFSRYDLSAWSPDAIRDTEYNAWALMTAGVLTDLPDLSTLIDSRFAPDDSP